MTTGPKRQEIVCHVPKELDFPVDSVQCIQYIFYGCSLTITFFVNIFINSFLFLYLL